MKLKQTIKKILRGIFYLIYGKPDYVFLFWGGLGDHLLTTIITRHYYGLGKKVWVVSKHKELYRHNPSIKFRLPFFFLSRLEFGYVHLKYLDPPIDGKETSPESHIIKILCKSAYIENVTIKKSPEIFLTQKEKTSFSKYQNYIAICSSGLGAISPMYTKEWIFENYQTLADLLSKDYKLVQIGLKVDPKIKGIEDLSGKLSVRETAALLSNAKLYIGQVGFLMHLANAVNCRSVIIFGGREKPWQSGYENNYNVASSPACSPCWKYRCDFDMDCMKQISAEMVYEKAKLALENYKGTFDELIKV